MNYNTIKLELAAGVARLTLNRPAQMNALNGDMYDEMRHAVAWAGGSDAVRVVVITGEGTAFCSGGDLAYQQSQATRPHDERLAEASKLALMLQEINVLPKPVIARVNGLAYGGGLGLVAASDIAVAHDEVRFALPEVTLGLMPSMISPFVVAKMGTSHARSVFLSGRPFGAQEALRFGLVHEHVPMDDLDMAVQRHVDFILRCAPGAVAQTKQLISFVHTHDDRENFKHTVGLVAQMWTSPEAQEGMSSFLAKRKPSWRTPQSS